MITQAVAQKIKGTESLHTLSALTHRRMVELLGRKVISLELFDEQHIVEVLDPEDTKRRWCFRAEIPAHVRECLCPAELGLSASVWKPELGDQVIWLAAD